MEIRKREGAMEFQRGQYQDTDALKRKGRGARGGALTRERRKSTMQRERVEQEIITLGMFLKRYTYM